ncbi:MAG: hypothetical protein ACU83N_04320 [Gammaproteobacteria bacterium]
MKTLNQQTLKTLAIVITGICAGALSLNAAANDRKSVESDAKLIYQTRSINHSIFSYLGNIIEEVAVDPKLIYVSQAYGPAIHSYVHSSTETTVPWNVEYVNTAYNPAIYSYEGPLLNGEVELLPTVSID